MAENMNYRTPNGASRCYGASGDENNSNCDKYGRLYDWETAMAGSASSSENPSGVKGVCPTGWHLPSHAEWTELITLAYAGTKLKATNGWNNNGTDDYGFSALPGGQRYSNGNFVSAGYDGWWWSATEINSTSAYRRDSGFGSNTHYLKSYLYSVRCLQD